MLLSFNWLKQFVAIPKSITPEKLGGLLTLSTVEVEGIKKQGELLDNVVVGQIVKLESHPNADKLRIAHVNINPKLQTLNPKQYQNSNFQISKNDSRIPSPASCVKVVCGGVNLREGMLVAFAKVSARVKWHGQGEPVVLEKATIRGVESSGMICSASEVGLENLFPQESDHHIVDLTNTSGLKIGQPLAQALGLDDVIIEVENKSLTNRPDLWSHYGVAREIGALLKLKIKNQKPKINIKNINIDKLNVEIHDNKKCPRYLGVVIDGIKIAPSPLWMSRQLETVGVRAINNVVDITNYVLMELGQPLHAFDFSLIAADKRTGSRGSQIIVRHAKEGERMFTLDGVERQLTTDDLVIADANKPVALAGVMGGANSEIKNETTKIIIESANFEPSGIRRTESRTGLRTEASIRFEKALSPELAEEGIMRAIELILELIPAAKVTSKIIDVGAYKPKKKVIDLDLEYLNRIVGVEIPEKRVAEILKSLEFKVTTHETRNATQVLSVIVPSFRATKDVSIQEDLIEEVSRIYGYQNLKPEMPEVKLEAPKINTERQLERQIKNILVTGFGFNEVQNYSFVDPKLATLFGYAEDDLIAVANPAAPENSLLRPTLLINLAKNIKDNLRYFDKFKLFEIGRVFAKERGEFNADLTNKEFLPKQDKYLNGVVVGEDAFALAKAAVENLLEELELLPCPCLPRAESRGQVSSIKLKDSVAWVDSERILEVKLNGKTIGRIAELNETVRANLKIKSRVGVFDLNFTKLAKLPKTKIKEFQELPIYPSVTRDLAIIVSQGIMYQDIAKLINAQSPLIIEVELFDVYQGKNLGEGQRSLAFHIVFRAPDRTLESKEVDEIFGQVVKKLEEKFGARLR